MTMMSILKIDALQALYSFYDDFTDRINLACGPGCSTCCSVNVSITSLEAAFLRQHPALSDTRLWERINAAHRRPHFIPSLTTNRIAHHCLHRQEPPEEKGMHAPGACPLLGPSGLCLAYENRPFSCRAMSSIDKCQADGEAVMPPFLMTINLAVYQLIEHLDVEGSSGNMLDMLADDGRNRIANTPFPGFLITDEEKPPFQRFVKPLKNYVVKGGHLADFFPPQTFNLN